VVGHAAWSKGATTRSANHDRAGTFSMKRRFPRVSRRPSPSCRRSPAPLMAKRRLGILGNSANPGSNFRRRPAERFLDAHAGLGYRYRDADLEGGSSVGSAKAPSSCSPKARELAKACVVDAILTEGTPCTLAAQAANAHHSDSTRPWGDPGGGGFAKEPPPPRRNTSRAFRRTAGELARKAARAHRQSCCRRSNAVAVCVRGADSRGRSDDARVS
jgi:hypothetical protein